MTSVQATQWDGRERAEEDDVDDNAAAAARAKAREAEIVRYERQRVRVVEQFRALGYGSQKEAAFALNIHPGIVNAVLAGRIISAEKLDRMDSWSVEEAAKRAAEPPAEHPGEHPGE